MLPYRYSEHHRNLHVSLQSGGSERQTIKERKHASARDRPHIHHVRPPSHTWPPHINLTLPRYDRDLISRCTTCFIEPFPFFCNLFLFSVHFDAKLI